LQAQYIEVFAPNVKAFPEAINLAHDELLRTPPAHKSIKPCSGGKLGCK